MKYVKGFGIVAALLLVFAACSSGGSSDAVSSERSRAAEPAATADEPTEGAGGDEMHMDEHADDDDADAVEAVDGAHTVEVEMTEFAFEPDTLTVPAGEPVTFVFHNTGAIDHEAMVGDAHMQEEFALSDGHGDHASGGHHGDVHAVTVPPGETAELVVTFDEPGETMLGCHLEGHWDAGMVATVTVT